MSEFIHKSHNINVLLYHYVCPAKYRRSVFSLEVDYVLQDTCREISERYEIKFLEIGCDENHVHFLLQSVPRYSPAYIAKIIKGITAREIFKRCPQVQEYLWGGELWSDGYFVSTVGRYGSEKQIESYVRSQGKTYKKFYQGEQLTLW